MHYKQPAPVLQHNNLADIRTSEAYTDKHIDEAIQHFAECALDSLQIVTWDRVRQCTTSNEDMHQYVFIIENGMPQLRNYLPDPIRDFHQFNKHLYTIDGFIMYKETIVIPPNLHTDIFLAFHSAHSGVSTMTARAESSVFWPGITPAIIATHLPQQVILPTSTQCDILLYRA